MAIALYRNAALTLKFSSGLPTNDPNYRGLFDDEADFNATQGEEVVRVAYVADDVVRTNHHTFCGAQLRVQAGQTTDINADGTSDIELYAARPVETNRTDNFVGTGAQTTFVLARKFVKPGSETVTVGGNTSTRGTHYGINYLNGTVIFASAPGNGVPVSVQYVHGDNGSGSVNIPSNSSIKANGNQIPVALWNLPERSGGLKGSTPDGIPVIFLAVVKPNSLERTQMYLLSQARAEVRGLLTEGAL